MHPKPQSIFAVATNIITRGLPTLASVHLEEYFASCLSLTNRINDNARGKVMFPFVSNEENREFGKTLFKSLHTIDSRAKDRHQYLKVSDVDSSFERNFLLQLLPKEKSYLAQVLEKQRARNTFTRDNNQGRVDFSIEIPYNFYQTKTNRYNSTVDIKHHKIHIVEVDGKKYHTDLLDDLKDFEIAQLSRQISHIKEDRVYKDIEEFIRTIESEEYIQILKENYFSNEYLLNNFSALCLAPFGIARIQRVLLQYLMSNFEIAEHKQSISVAVVERDFPCGSAAIEDLNLLLQTINDLAKTQVNIPLFEAKVFSSEEYQNHPLHNGNSVSPISELNNSVFDIVIDISVLRRASIFNDDMEQSNNSIIIRNAHYTHYKTNTGVISAPSIVYRDLVEQLQNEVYEPIIETSDLLKKLLQNIFRKIDFREG